MNVTRTNLTATNEFLCHQIGRMETRRERVPVYENGVVVRHDIGGTVSVFRLLGFGETPAAAKRMASATLSAS